MSGAKLTLPLVLYRTSPYGAAAMIRPSLSRYVLLSLVAFALLVGGATPRGWMPARAADGSIKITICPGGLNPSEHEALLAQVQMKLDAALGKKKDQQPGEQDNGQCPYATAAHAATLSVPPVPRQYIAATAPAVPGLPLETTVGRGLAAPQPPARGPPLIS